MNTVAKKHIPEEQNCWNKNITLKQWKLNKIKYEKKIKQKNTQTNKIKK